MHSDDQELSRTARLLRFGATGVFATGIHIATATALITQAGAAPYIANPIAFLVATVASYVINTHWSFSQRMDHRTLMRYGCVAVMGCLGSTAISAVAEMARLDFRLGIALVIVLVTPATFMLHNMWTYRVKQTAR